MKEAGGADGGEMAARWVGMGGCLGGVVGWVGLGWLVGGGHEGGVMRVVS